jgi:hypothetical protein
MSEMTGSGDAHLPRFRGRYLGQTALRLWRRSWFGDVRLSGRVLLVCKTGARLRLDGALAHEALSWVVFHAAILLRRAAGRFGGAGPRVAFYPDRPRPWYLIWVAIIAGGGRIVDDPARADIVMQFDDTVESWHAPPPGIAGAAVMNGAAGDIRKSTVAAAFAAAFGYPLTIDPAKATGLGVEKSEANGVHDGRLIPLPRAAQPGCVYQRFIDTSAPNGLVDDLRTPTLWGVPLAVFIKRRRARDRFSNDNAACLLRHPEEVFSPQEIAAIGRFCSLIGFEWGGLDILRDREDGRLYIVDANKTDMGPPIALPLNEKMRAADWIGEAFADYAARRVRAQP